MPRSRPLHPLLGRWDTINKRYYPTPNGRCGSELPSQPAPPVAIERIPTPYPPPQPSRPPANFAPTHTQTAPQTAAPPARSAASSLPAIPPEVRDAYTALTRYYADFTRDLARYPFIALGILGGLCLYFFIAAYGDPLDGFTPAAVTRFRRRLIIPLLALIGLGYLKGTGLLTHTSLRSLDGAEFSVLSIIYVPTFVLCHLMVPVRTLQALSPFVRGFHFLFVPHPAKHYLAPALHGHGTPLNTVGIASVLEDIVPERTLRFVNRNMARKAAKMSEKLREQEHRLREETRLADAALEYERARNIHDHR